MGSSGVSSAVLVILNILNVVFGLALTAASIWFFIELQNVTSLRNQNHYLLDYKVYWPQAVPWIFLFSGIFVLMVSCCGFVGAKKQSRSVVLVYAIFQVIALVILIIATIIALVFADSSHTDQFVADTIWDAYNNMKGDRSVESAFGVLEKRYQCCGAGGPRDYKNWRPNFPPSCCDTYYHGWSTGEYIIDCDITNKLPNERLGCAEVASHYARTAIKVFSAAAVFTALIGIVNLVVALLLSKSLKKRKPMDVSVTAQNEFESKKVLL